MSDDSAAIVHISRKVTLGDRLRNIADQLQQEREIQIKATSRILGAAAKLAENHDRLIDEVVEMVEEDLDRAEQAAQAKPYTVKQLKQQFPKLADAKAHFDVKASSWSALVARLNEQQSRSPVLPPSPQADLSPANSPGDVISRLDTIEEELRKMRSDMNRMIQLLEQVVTTQDKQAG